MANTSNTEERTYPLADTADHQSPRPDFAIAAYTARMLDTRKGKNSLDLKPWVKISAKAPPTLIIHAMDDPVDDIRGAAGLCARFERCWRTGRFAPLRQGQPRLWDSPDR